MGEDMAAFLFVLKQDDIDAATRCFQLAKVAHSKGNDVNLFLVDDGVLWADNSRDFNVKSKTGDCPGDYFPYLVDNEVSVGV